MAWAALVRRATMRLGMRPAATTQRSRGRASETPRTSPLCLPRNIFEKRRKRLTAFIAVATGNRRPICGWLSRVP